MIRIGGCFHQDAIFLWWSLSAKVIYWWMISAQIWSLPNHSVSPTTPASSRESYHCPLGLPPAPSPRGIQQQLQVCPPPALNAGQRCSHTLARSLHGNNILHLYLHHSISSPLWSPLLCSRELLPILWRQVTIIATPIHLLDRQRVLIAYELISGVGTCASFPLFKCTNLTCLTQEGEVDCESWSAIDSAQFLNGELTDSLIIHNTDDRFSLRLLGWNHNAHPC